MSHKMDARLIWVKVRQVKEKYAKVFNYLKGVLMPMVLEVEVML